MTEKEYVKSYALGMIILSFLDEFTPAERGKYGSLIYENILEKHNYLVRLVKDREKKKKSLSSKCQTFIDATKLAEEAWSKSLEQTREKTYAVNSLLRYLFSLNEIILKKHYKLKSEWWKHIDKNDHGLLLQSCGVATIINKEINQLLNKKFVSN